MFSLLSWFSGSLGWSETHRIVEDDLDSLIFLLLPSDVGMTGVLHSLQITNRGPCARTLPTESHSDPCSFNHGSE